MKFTSLRNILSCTLLVISFLALSYHFNYKLIPPKINIDKQSSALNFKPAFYDLISLGHNKMISSLLWITTLLEMDHSHYKIRDLNSWMYLRFSQIAKLDPYFYENYILGGTFLSIIKDDIIGAEEILKLGVSYYPLDYGLNYYGGFNAFYELKDYARAIFYWENLEKLPGIHQKFPMLNGLINKARANKSGDLNSALIFMQNAYANEQNEFIKKRLHKQLYAIKAELDLTCLNEIQDNQKCSHFDLEGKPYVKKEGRYTAPLKYKRPNYGN